MLIDKLQQTLNTRQIADLLDVSESTVRSLLKNGSIRHIKIGGRLRVLREDLEKYVESNLH